MRYRRNRILLFLLLLLLQIVPFAFAFSQTHPGWVFGGFLLNPADGNSYLAKMQEGLAGSWRFQLLYSPNEVRGGFLFLFYLFLGHVAGWFNLPLLLVFHCARLLSDCLLFVSLGNYLDTIFHDNPHSGDIAMWLVTVGSGMGWLVALTGGVLTGDFWIAEAFPFLSMFANPHFPLGLALLLWILVLDQTPTIRWRGPVALLLSLLLAVIQPFGIVILAGLLCANWFIRWILERKLNFSFILWSFSLGGPFLMYQWLVIRGDPYLAAWDLQNVTPAPPIWDFALSLSPAIIFAFVGIFLALKQRRESLLQVSAWILLGVLLVYFPFNLQRRFMTGLYIPVAVLSVSGVLWLVNRPNPALKRQLALGVPALIGLSVVTNLLILISVFAAVLSKQPNPKIYIPEADIRAMLWMREHTPPGSVVLANADVGQLIPAWSGRRVIYGHPFESVNADKQKGALTQFFSGVWSMEDQKDYLATEHPSYIYLNTAEQASLHEAVGSFGENVYNQDNVQIVKVKP